MSEKRVDVSLPAPAVTSAVQSKRKRWPPLLCLVIVLGLYLLPTDLNYAKLALPTFRHSCHEGSPIRYTSTEIAAASCPAQPASMQKGKTWDIMHDQLYADLASSRLSQAVQHRTESYDDLPLDPTDSRFDKHYAFASFLESEFPKVFDALSHETVNTHAHLFTWKGSEASLKPVLLMAHTDTVPVLEATLGAWTYDPFAGQITVDGTAETPGTWLWGRGVSDCKNSLMGILGAVERLVTEGFKPERTIVLSFGFDEEVGGFRGAGKLHEVMYDRYGPDSIEFLVDEGFSGLSNEFGSWVASLGMAEKGSINFDITVETLGGHSSIPPEHTGIGVMSKILSAMEDNPFEPELSPNGPYLKYLQCMSDHAVDMPLDLKASVKNPRTWPRLATKLAKSNRYLNSFLATTQAVDLVNGGVKINALPEVVTSSTNYRISFTSSVAETKSHVSKVVSSIAKSLNFTLSAFESEPKKTSPSHITLAVDPRRGPLEPAPITSGTTNIWKLVAGTCKSVFGPETIVSPTGMFANTDTKFFWDMTKDLYRFTPALLTENLFQHTVDERISLHGHLNTTLWYYTLLQNTQGFEA